MSDDAVHDETPQPDAATPTPETAAVPAATAPAAAIETPAWTAPAREPGKFVETVTAPGGRRYARAAVTTLIVYAAAWILALIFTLLALAGSGAPSQYWSLLAQLPSQLLGLALGGVLSASVGITGLSATVSLFVLPLLLTAAVIAGIVIVSRREERLAPSATRTARWLLSGASGLVLALFSLLLAAVIPAVISTAPAATGLDAGSATAINPFASLSVRLTFSAASVSLFFGALIIGTLAAWFARTGAVSRRSAVLTTFAEVVVAGRTAVLGLTLYGIVAGVAIAIVEIIGVLVNSGGNSLWSLPLWLPTAVLNGLAFINFAPLGLSGSLLAFPGLGSVPTSEWMPASLPAWATIVVVVLNLALIAAIGLIVALRQRAVPATRSTAWASVVVAFALAGVVVSALGSVLIWARADLSGLGSLLTTQSGSASTGAGAFGSLNLIIGPAAWTFLLFAIVGALVQVSAIWVSPVVLPLLPASIVSRATRSFVPAVVAPVVITPTTDAATTEAPTTDAATTEYPTLPLGATAAPLAPAAAVTPMDPKRKRRLQIILGSVGGAIVLIILIVVAVSIINSTVFSPQNQAQHYLDSVVAKDASKALDAGQVSSKSAPLLTDSVLHATSGGITAYSITSTTVTGDRAVIAAKVTQGGKTSPLQLTAHRDGSTALVFGNWKLDTVTLPKLVVSVSGGISSLKINGATVPVSKDDLAAGSVSLSAFPGKYSVGLGGSTKYVAASTQHATVTASALVPAVAQLTVEPTQAFRDALTTQIGGFLTSCASQAVLAPKGCPFEYFGFGTTKNIVWKITTSPKLSLDPADDGSWNVTSDEPGEAAVTFKETFFGSTYPENGESSIYLTGTVDLSSGSPVFTYRSEF
jgi:hypothetical protein